MFDAYSSSRASTGDCRIPARKQDAGLYTGEQLSSHKVARDVLNMTLQQFATTGSGLDLSVAADVTRASLGMHASTHRLIGLIG